MSYPAAWWEQLLAEVPPERPVVFQAGSPRGLSLKQLNAAAYCLAAYWMLRGLQPGECVVLLGMADIWYPAIEMSIQLAGGLSLALDPRQPEDQLRALVQASEARFYYCADYRLYTQFRMWLDPLTQPRNLVCTTDRGDRLQETDRLTTLEAALYVGKNWWREHRADLEARKSEPRPTSPSLRWVESTDGCWVIRELNRAERLAWLRAQLPTVRQWPARPRVLTVAPEWRAWAVGVGRYWPLRVAERLILVPPHPTTVLQQLRQQRIGVLVADGQWLVSLVQQLTQQFQTDYPLRKRYLNRAYRNDQRHRLAVQRGESLGFFEGLKRWPSHRFIFRKIKKRYLGALQVVVVDPGPWVDELSRFFSPLNVRILVDSGAELQNRAGLHQHSAGPTAESAARA